MINVFVITLQKFQKYNRYTTYPTLLSVKYRDKNLLSFLKQKKDQNIFAKFILIGTLLILGNVAIVALAEPTSSRYLFYNNWILLSIVMLLFQLSFYKKIDE